jgi:hypothetical protein
LCPLPSLIQTFRDFFLGAIQAFVVELFLSFWTPWKCSDEEAGMDGGNRKAFGLLDRSEPGSDPMPFTYLVLAVIPAEARIQIFGLFWTPTFVGVTTWTTGFFFSCAETSFQPKGCYHQQAGFMADPVQAMVRPRPLKSDKVESAPW